MNTHHLSYSCLRHNLLLILLTCKGNFIEDLESWLEHVYQADGERKTLDVLYDEWASDYDLQYLPELPQLPTIEYTK